MEDFNGEQLDSGERASRPGFLTVLCVLSFISLGLSGIGTLGSLMSGRQSEDAMLAQTVEMKSQIAELKEAGMNGLAELLEKINNMGVETNEHFYLATVLGVILVGLGLFAVIKMFKGFKQGFHLYIVYNLLAIISIYFYISPSNIPSFVIIFNVLLSGLFVFLYSRNLKWMTK